QLILDRYRTLFAKFFEQDAALSRRRFRLHVLAALLAEGALYGCYGFVVWRAVNGALTVGDLTLAFALFTRGQDAFGSILQTAASMYENALFMTNLFAFLNVEAPGERAAVRPARMLPKGPHTLELENVSFRYPGKQTWALRNVSLKLVAGQKLGLVGEN